jgi:hypothetical protein
VGREGRIRAYARLQGMPACVIHRGHVPKRGQGRGSLPVWRRGLHTSTSPNFYYLTVVKTSG